MRKFSLIFAALLCTAFSLSAQDIVLSKADSSYIERTKVINDYSMIGIQYGVSLSTVSFDPNRYTDMQFVPVNVGVTYTRYGKMFGYMPYFGIQLGLFYTQDAYRFAINEKTGVGDYILGASKAVIQNVELPVMAHLHYDFWKMKILLNVGPFIGYRVAIQRSEYNYGRIESFMQYENQFHPNENRFDYGIKGGAGLAFVFDPIEIHLTAAYKYSLSNLHQPDVNRRSMEHDDKSKTYYNWSYPTNIVIGIGIHYQITNRIGLTKKQLKQEALLDVRETYKDAIKAIEDAQKVKEELEKEKLEAEKKAHEHSKKEEKTNPLDQSFNDKTVDEVSKSETKTEAGTETDIQSKALKKNRLKIEPQTLRKGIDKE